jgi:hypothetical protein
MSYFDLIRHSLLFIKLTRNSSADCTRAPLKMGTTMIYPSPYCVLDSPYLPLLRYWTLLGIIGIQ